MIEKMSERLSLKKQFTEVQKILNGIIRMRNDDKNLMEEDELSIVFQSLSVISIIFSSTSVTCLEFCCMYAICKIRRTHQRRRLSEEHEL